MTKHPHSRSERLALERLDEKKVKTKAERAGKVRRRLAIEQAKAEESQNEIRSFVADSQHGDQP